MNTRRVAPLIALGLFLHCAPVRANAADAPNPTFKGKKLLLVAALSSPTAPVDQNIKKHFESLGMTVNMVTDTNPPSAERSEERRVGKECRSRWSPYH